MTARQHRGDRASSAASKRAGLRERPASKRATSSSDGDRRTSTINGRVHARGGRVQLQGGRKAKTRQLGAYTHRWQLGQMREASSRDACFPTRTLAGPRCPGRREPWYRGYHKATRGSIPLLGRRQTLSGKGNGQCFTRRRPRETCISLFPPGFRRYEHMRQILPPEDVLRTCKSV